MSTTNVTYISTNLDMEEMPEDLSSNNNEMTDIGSLPKLAIPTPLMHPNG